MTGMKKITDLHFREQMTSAILELLAGLPELHKKTFIWKHYCGYRVEEISKKLNCSEAHVNDILRQVHTNLYQRTGALLA